MSTTPEFLCNCWDRFYDRLRVIGRSIANHSVGMADLDDFVQEAFIELAKQSSPPADPLAWLVRVMRNRILDQYRSETRRRRREQDYVERREQDFDRHRSSLGLVQNELHSTDVDHDLTHTISALPNEQREIVVMHVWGEMSFEQIGLAIGKSSSSCHRRYKKALHHLENELQRKDTNRETSTTVPNAVQPS